MRKLLKEPLIQFLLIALMLLGGERLINSDDYANEQYRILVDDQVLLHFMQLQAKMFKPSQAKAALEAMSAEDRQRLVDDYSRNEVLFREAMALNLNKNDQIIRRRLIQKMDYLAQGFYNEAEPLSEDDLRDYYTEYQQDYKKAASTTFTHVFISADNRDVSEAKDIAGALLKTLNAEQVPFENAPRYGERFLYNRNYVNRDDDEIGSHFGDEFKGSLFAFGVSDINVGPLGEQRPCETRSLKVPVRGIGDEVEACIPAWNVRSAFGAGVDDISFSDINKGLCSLHCTP